MKHLPVFSLFLLGLLVTAAAADILQLVMTR